MTPNRAMFWQIENTWLFYVLAVAALGFFAAGVGAHLVVWRKVARASRITLSKIALGKTALDAFLGRRVLKGDIAAGVMHLLIFWGFLILFMGTSLLAVDHYVVPFLTGSAYLAFSWAMEAGGISVLAGVVWALIRRYVERVPRLERRLEDAIIPLWLLLAVLSGFLLEGSRLALQEPPWGHWSFAGWWIRGLLPSTADGLYPCFWWGHALICLGFLSVIPYTKLFHLLGAPAAIYLREVSGPAVFTVEEEAREFDLGDAVFFDGCMRCGRCVAVCPSTGAGEPFAPRDFVQAMRHRMWQEHSPVGDIRFLDRAEGGDAEEKYWYCTTCGACLEVCPVYGAAFEPVTRKRVLAVEEGTGIPRLLNQTLEKLFKYHNPWESSKRQRGAWAKGLGITDLTKRGARADLCYFVGCTTSLDDTAGVIARSLSEIFRTAGVDFGILGKKEPCCGDIARRVGELGLFEEQREGCAELLDKLGITDLVTSSPHCFHTLKNEYAAPPFRARHYTLLLRELIADGRIRFNGGTDLTVTYHDPCYLGRHNRIFDEPREIIRSIPGVRLKEMVRNRADSLCCGGGGGRIWQDLNGEVKMSHVRLMEAAATGAQVLITACPLCLIMLEDARKAAGVKDPFRVMDLAEFVLDALER